MKYDVFISYSHRDIKLIRPMVDALESSDVTVFTDEKISLGCNIVDSIAEAIENSTNFLMIVTEAYCSSVYAQSEEELPIDIRRKEIISLSSFRNTLADYVN